MKKYINDKDALVPDNKILVVPVDIRQETFYEEIIVPFKGLIKRDWFTSFFYHCLPINIANQYGFGIKSLVNFDAVWPGEEAPAEITFLDDQNLKKQNVFNHFQNGIITFQNHFSLKTPPGINLMTMQTPNMFIPGVMSMNGVVETDQMRRDFSFNLKMTTPNFKVSIRKGDIVAAFMPIPRYFVENFEVEPADNYFSLDIIENEAIECQDLGKERDTVDKKKPNFLGKRYFSGFHTDGSKYTDHQKRI